MSPHGNFYWNELMTRDPEQAKKFYGTAIGWTFEGTPMEEGTYWVANMNGEPVAGIFPMVGPDFDDMPDSWLPYLAVDNVDARVQKAVASGAQICRDPFDVPGVGRIAIIYEPGGAMIGFMTPAEQ